MPVYREIPSLCILNTNVLSRPMRWVTLTASGEPESAWSWGSVPQLAYLQTVGQVKIDVEKETTVSAVRHVCLSS